MSKKNIRASIHLSLGDSHKIVIDENGEIVDLVSAKGDELAEKIVKEINSGKFSSGKDASKWAKQQNS